MTSDVLVLRGSLDRESLHLAVVRLPAAPMRLAWLAEQLRSGALPNSGIIYTLTVAAAYETAAFLREQGIAVTAYSGKDDQAQRLAAEDDLLDNRVKALVATSALGMGFDKPDLGFVVHLGAPQSPVAYYQQIGRAGRGVERADVVLLPGREDRDIWAYFASLAFPPERQVRATLETPGGRRPAAVHRRARDPRRPVPGAAGDDAQGARRGRRGDPHRRRLDGHRPAVGLRRRALRAGGRGAVSASSRRCSPTRRPTGAGWSSCGASSTTPRRPRAGGATTAPAQPWPADVPEAGVAAAQDRLARPGVSVEPRKMWPTGMKELGIDGASGKIPASRTAEPGRALGRLHRRGLGRHAARAARRGGPRRAGHRAAHRRGGQGARGLGLGARPVPW